MSKSFKKRGGSKFQKKKLPMAKTRIDNMQSKRIVKVESKLTKLAKETELKHRDVFVDAVSADDNPDTTQIILLNGVPQITTVDGDTLRAGNEIRITSLQIRGYLSLNQNTNVGTAVRVMIFWDRQANGAAPSIDDVLDASTITERAIAPIEFDEINRFKIIYDKIHLLYPQVQATQLDTNEVAPTDNTITTTLFGGQRRPFRIYKKLNKKVFMGLSATGTITAITSNSLYLAFFSLTPTASNPPTVTFGARIYFKDA